MWPFCAALSLFFIVVSAILVGKIVILCLFEDEDDIAPDDYLEGSDYDSRIWSTQNMRQTAQLQ